MKKLLTLFSFLAVVCCLAINPAAVLAQDSEYEGESTVEVVETEDVAEEAEEESRSIPYRLFIYIPNRVLDLLDIVRFRARVGPGIGLGVRATKPLSAELSSYATLYLGLPGPRRARTVRSPIGAELYSGLGFSVLDLQTENYAPHYSSTEFGLDFQLLVAGASVGIDPLEILDFVTGFVGIEVVEDDL